MKHGKLRHVRITPSYDEHGKIGGHKVEAEYEAAPKGKGADGTGEGAMPNFGERPSETLHSGKNSHGHALAKAKEHLTNNAAEYGETTNSSGTGDLVNDHDEDDAYKSHPMRNSFGPKRK